MIDPVIFRQIPLIQRIIADEAWLEAERRGCWVSADDPVVRDRVCLVILRIGGEVRETLTREVADAPRQIPLDDHPPQAA